jgi:hypothetical protein
VRTLEFAFPMGGNVGTIRLKGATSPTGGPVTSTVEFRSNHSFSASTVAPFTATWE